MLEKHTPRIGDSAAWTGSAMLVWGGETNASGFDAVATGGRYDPGADSWAPMSLVDVPSARPDHVGAWLGSFMAVWGGRANYELDRGGRYVVDNPDGDADGVADVCDCVPSNPTASSIPAAVTGLTLAPDKTTVQWTSAAPGSGSGTVHDFVRGRLVEPPVGTGGAESCVAPRTAEASAPDPSIPPAVDGYWYLVRGRNDCGTGTVRSGLERSGGDQRRVSVIDMASLR